MKVGGEGGDKEEKRGRGGGTGIGESVKPPLWGNNEKEWQLVLNLAFQGR